MSSRPSPAASSAPATRSPARSGRREEMAAETSRSVSGRRLHTRSLGAETQRVLRGGGKPSLEKAREFQLRMHPSYTPTGREEDRRFYACCVPMGRFCLRACERCDPCFEGRVSTFTELGSGVTSYFKSSKLFAWAFLLMCFAAAPMLVLNVAGRGPLASAATLTLDSTTVGHLSFINGTTNLHIPYMGTATTGLEGRTGALLYGLCDVACCAILLVAFLVLRPMSLVEARQVDKDVVSASDYTVFLPWVPPMSTEADVVAYIESLTRAAAVEAAEYGYPALFAVAEVHLVEDSTAAVSVFIQRGHVYRQMERLVENLMRCEAELAARDAAGAGAGCAPCGGLRRTIERLKAQRERLQARSDVLSEQASLKASKRACAAFVTFERTEARNWTLEQFSGGGIVGWAFQRASLRFRGARMRIVEAPAPSSIVWGNLHISRFEQVARQALTALLALLLLTGSFTLLWFASWEQQKFSRVAQVADCSTFAGFVVPSYANATVPGWEAAAVVYAKSLPPTDSSLYCHCATLRFDTLSLSALQRSAWTPRCPYQACPAWFTLDVAGVWGQTSCVAWLSERSVIIAITVAASTSVLLVNALLAYAMRFLTFIEGHGSFEELNSSLALRLFWASVINTALLVVVINIAWPFTLPEQFATGKYSDFATQWYSTVGTSLMIICLLNIIAPHVYYGFAALFSWWRRRSRTLSAPSQRDLNELMLGPYFDWSTRYAQQYNTLFVTFIFAAGMPLMFYIGFASFFISYWIDKVLFLWYFRRPPAFGISIERTMSTLVPYALVLHLALGMWMLSASPALASAVDPFQLSAIIAQGNAFIALYVSPTITQGFSRVTVLTSLPLFILFCAIVAVMLAQCLLAGFARTLAAAFNAATCNACPGVCRWCDGRRQLHGSNWQADAPSFSEACSPQLAGTARGMRGIPSYNLLLNPEIMAAFAIPYSFARTHKRIADVAAFRSTGLVSGRFLVAGALTGSPRDTVIATGEEDGGEEEDEGETPAYLREEFGLDSPRAEQFDETEEDVADEDEDRAAMAGVPAYYAVSQRRFNVAADPQRLARLDAAALHARGVI